MSDKAERVARLIYFDDDGTGKTSVERIAAILREEYPEEPEAKGCLTCRYAEPGCYRPDADGDCHKNIWELWEPASKPAQSAPSEERSCHISQAQAAEWHTALVREEEENKRLRAALASERDKAIEDFRMDELDAVMVSVDKWFDEGDPRLKQNPAQRAADAREIALRAIEAEASGRDKGEGKAIRFSIKTLSGKTLDNIEIIDFANIYHDEDVVYANGEPCRYSTLRLESGARPAPDVSALREAIGALYLKHAECEDSWYSCPMSDHGCVNPDDAGCTCGAEAHNRRVDSALALLRSGPKEGA